MGQQFKNNFFPLFSLYQRLLRFSGKAARYKAFKNLLRLSFVEGHEPWRQTRIALSPIFKSLHALRKPREFQLDVKFYEGLIRLTFCVISSASVIIIFVEGRISRFLIFPVRECALNWFSESLSLITTARKQAFPTLWLLLS